MGRGDEGGRESERRGPQQQSSVPEEIKEEWARKKKIEGSEEIQAERSQVGSEAGRAAAAAARAAPFPSGCASAFI